MNILIQIILLIFIAAASFKATIFFQKYSAEKWINDFLASKKLTEQVLGQQLNFNRGRDQYEVFIVFKDEPNVCYRFRLGNQGTTYITAYDQEQRHQLVSSKEAKYLKYNGYRKY